MTRGLTHHIAAIRSKVLVLVLTSASSLSASEKNVKLIPEQPNQIATLARVLEKKQIGSRVDTLTVQSKQTFKLVQGSATKLTFISVNYVGSDANQGHSLKSGCGVYLIKPDGSMKFFSPLNSDQEQVGYHCWRVTAVRLQRHSGEPPDFLVTCDFSLTSHAYTAPFTIRWDKQLVSYQADTAELP